MRLHEFPHLSKDLIRLESSEPSSTLAVEAEILLIPDGSSWLLTQSEQSIPVKPVKDAALFKALASRRETLWLLRKREGRGLWLQSLNPIERLNMELCLGVDGLIVDDLLRNGEITSRDIGAALAWLKMEFLIEEPGHPARMVVAHYANSTTPGFQVIGKSRRADVVTVEDGSYVVRRIGPRKAMEAYRVLEGDLSFSDVTVAGQLQNPIYKAMLSAALENTSAYLELWKSYNDIAWNRAQKWATELDVLAFEGVEGFERDGGNAWRLTPKNKESLKSFQERWRELDRSGGDQVEISERLPDWSAALTEEKDQQRTVRGKLTFEADSVVIQADERRKGRKPPEKGYIYYSLAGERAIGKRREEAKRIIDSGRRMPQLRFLLEGVPVPADERRARDPLTPYARETFGKNGPTDRQRHALKVALDTPDIALIIGPPGTGKTQVIAALLRRLTDEYKDHSLRGQVLVSSYQHDAVDNALSRSFVFGLPPARVGGRQSSEEVSVEFEYWSRTLAERMEARVQELEAQEPLLRLMKSFQRQCQLLRMVGLDIAGRLRALDQLNDVLAEIQARGVILPPRTLVEWKHYLAEQRQRMVPEGERADRRSILARVRSLRVTAVTFADDGPDRAHDVLRALHREGIALEQVEHQLLESAAEMLEAATPAVLQKMGLLRDQLLDRLLPDFRPPSVRGRLDAAGLRLLSDLESALETHISRSREGVAGVLAQLADALMFNPLEAQATTQEYAMVVGATCQQAASTQMMDLKSLSGFDTNTIEFDTVVVDEAARANPLDLFVPMAMARSRIILVGDDRQLPHLLEPDIEADVATERNLSDLERKAFEVSLFERLRVQLQKSQMQDGIQRVVMLDTQFRMHKLLGDFVSRNFYEPAGMDPLKSGRPDEDFAHALPGYEGKVCAWLDVPLASGTAQRAPGGSLHRITEAETIAEEAFRLLKAAEGKLSVGVITFYSAQSLRIMEEMARLGVMERTPTGFEVTADFRATTDGHERFRVGTVDAFQGKEFDVVLLSCVRTTPKSTSLPTQPPEARDTELNRRFGFLRLSNRLNVAMSRQRRLLIVVGDRGLIKSDGAEEAIPALINFDAMCRGPYGCIR